MKKVLAILFCILFNMCANESIADEMYKINEIKDIIEKNWIENCESKENDIYLNVPVYIPNTLKLPVLRVKRTMINNEDLNNEKERITKNTIYGQRIENKIKFEFSENVIDFYQMYYQNLWTNKEKLNEVFADNQNKSLEDAVDFQKSIVNKFYNEEEIGCLPYRAGIKSCKYYNMAKGKVKLGEKVECGDMTGKGGYYVEAWETINGIPCISGIERTYTDVGRKYVQSALSNMSWIVLGEYIDDEYYTCIATSVWRKTGIELEDMKVCGFDKITNEVKRMILNGKIKDVYGITLGYVIFADKSISYPENENAYYNEYIAIPTWCVECKYSSNGIDYKQNNDDDIDAQSYHKEKGWRYLFINAQTGKVYDPEDMSNDRYFAKEIIK